MTTKTIDEKGRVSLGAKFAGKTVLIEEHTDELVLRLGQFVPSGEEWLWQNKQALASVQRGLDQAKRGERVDGPDLSASFAFADSLPEEVDED